MKIADLFVKLGLKKDEFDKGINDAGKKTNLFASTIKRVGGMIAGAFAIGQISAFSQESVKLAATAEGIEKAFNRLGGTPYLNELREATKGTVSDMRLMQSAVKATNLGLPIEQLGKLFSFAAQRAADTGESVDFLVESIVLGVGRKSLMILDNLGISAVQLKEKLNGVGTETATVGQIAEAVGRIASESMADIGDSAATAGQKIAGTTAAIDNLKVQFGKFIAESDFFAKGLADTADMLYLLGSNSFSAWEKILGIIDIAAFGDTAKAAIEAQRELDGVLDSYEEMEQRMQGQAKAIDKANNAIKVALKGTPKREKAPQSMTGGRGVEFGETPSDYFPTTLTNGKFENFMADDFFKPDNALKGIDGFYKALGERTKEQQAIGAEDWENFNAEFKTSIENGLGSVGTSLFAGIGELAAGVTTPEDFGKNILLTVGNFMQQLGSLFLSMGIEMALADAAIKLGPIGAPLLIAAGAGMIAAGAAISGLASKGLSGSSTSSASGYSSSGYTGASAYQTLQGSVTFELQGNMLAGVLNNTNERNRLMRG